MELHVLARRDVPEAARVAIGHVGERLELLGGEDSLRDLDAQHLRVFLLALSVGAAHEPERAPGIRADLPALEPTEHGRELVDFRLVGEAQTSASEGSGIVRD